MTSVATIIADAYKLTNLIPEVSDPSAIQLASGLRKLNTLLLSSVGNEAGDELSEINYGGDFDQSSWVTSWIPDNVRLMVDTTAAFTLFLDPYPYEGQRVAVVDIGNNLSTYPSVLDGNGKLIEGFETADLNEDGFVRQWLYRSDIGTWVKIAELEDSDDMPFPVEFDDYFIMMLGARINPQYGQSLKQESLQSLVRMRGQLRSRYRRKGYMAASDPGLVNPNDYRYFGNNWFDQGFIGNGPA